MSDELSEKTVMVYDLSGSYTHIAERLVSDFGRVLYFNQWESGFSNVIDYTPGEGLAGIEHVASPADYFDKIDLAVFPDVGLGDLQEYLRRQGIPVWGSGRSGDLERDRIGLKRALLGQRMDVPDYEVIPGLTALNEFLNYAPECWIKVSYFRGLTETHHFRGDYFLSEGWLNDIAVKLGPYKEEVPFLVEWPIDEPEAVEVGIDTHAIGGLLPRRMLWGYEAKDAGYIGTTLAVPKRLLTVSQQFMPALAGYCGPLSTEIRTTKDKDYLVDLTARYPSPPSECEVKNIKNFGRLLYDGARGMMTEADYEFNYVVQLVMTSHVLEERAMGIKIGIPERVALHGHCVFNGKDYVCSPQKIAEFAGAIGMNDDLEEAARECIEVAESIQGDGVKFDQAALDEIMRTIEKGEKLGLGWGVPV